MSIGGRPIKYAEGYDSIENSPNEGIIVLQRYNNIIKIKYKCCGKITEIKSKSAPKIISRFKPTRICKDCLNAKKLENMIKTSKRKVGKQRVSIDSLLSKLWVVGEFQIPSQQELESM